MAYQAPLLDYTFIATELVDIEQATAGEMTADFAATIWEEAGKFAEGVLLPLNVSGDREGVLLENHRVQTPKGFRAAWQALCENGWNNVTLPEQYGGQGLPWTVGTLVNEIFSASNKAFSMCHGLTAGAVEAIHHAASDTLKQAYLPKMVSGEWTGTMNLTEPGAGSDVGALKTRAVPNEDGESFRLYGQKIFISFGEHDMTDNIIHLVLARLPDSPKGVGGISLFLVPKFLADENGDFSVRNDVTCVGIEHKLGIHGSPTAALSFGDTSGAIGYLVGEANHGLAAMFVMMNMARLQVGMEGVASAEAALQLAHAYANERIQGQLDSDRSQSVAIIQHADVQRMIALMQSKTRAMRALAMLIAESQDIVERHADADLVAERRQLIDLLTPVFKGWATESGVDIASIGIQIFGGMGYCEETGAAQIWRDARISPIYEGTTGIQANDFAFRKLIRDEGRAFYRLQNKIAETVVSLSAAGHGHLSARLDKALSRLTGSIEQVIAVGREQPEQVKFVSVPLLNLAGNVIGAWLLSKGYLAAGQIDKYGADFCQQWRRNTEFYADYVLADASADSERITSFLSRGK